MKETKQKNARNVRRLRYGTTATVVTVAVIAAIVLLNVVVGIVADRFPVSLDLSKNKVFSLSEDSVAIAQKVTDTVEIVVFYDESEFSDPQTGVTYYNCPEYDTCMREFYQALKQYNTATGGKVTTRFVVPNMEPAEFAKYADYDVEELDILFLCGDRYRKSNVADLYETDFSGYSYTYFNSRVEKVLGANIQGLQTGEEHIVQVLTGHNENASTIAGLESMYGLNGYLFKQVDITTSVKFDPDAELMLIAAPQNDYSPEEIKRLQEWYYNDGGYNHHFLVFVDPVATCPNLNEFLEVEFDIKVKDSLLVETDDNRLMYNIPYYTRCDVPSDDFTPHSACTGKIFAPMTRRLTTDLPEKGSDGLISKYKYELMQFPESARLIDLADYNDSENTDEDQVYTPVSSAYPLTGMLACVYNTHNNYTDEDVSGVAIVCGCPMAAYADVAQNKSMMNEELFLDVANKATGAADGVTISSKVLTNDTLMFDGGVQLIVGLGVFTVGLPLITLIICLVVFLRRKNL